MNISLQQKLLTAKTDTEALPNTLCLWTFLTLQPDTPTQNVAAVI